MPKSKACYYKDCMNNSRAMHQEYMEGIFFIPFPKPKKQLEKCKRWINACGRPDFFTIDKIKPHHFICSEHFVGSQGPTQEYPDPMVYHPTKYMIDPRKADLDDGISALVENSFQSYEPPKTTAIGHNKERNQLSITSVTSLLADGIHQFGPTVGTQNICYTSYGTTDVRLIKQEPEVDFIIQNDSKENSNEAILPLINEPEIDQSEDNLSCSNYDDNCVKLIKQEPASDENTNEAILPSIISESEIDLKCEPEIGLISGSKLSQISAPEIGLKCEPEIGHITRKSLISEPEIGLISESKIGQISEPEVGQMTKVGLISIPKIGLITKICLASEPEIGLTSQSKIGQTVKVGQISKAEIGQISASKIGQISVPKIGQISVPKIGQISVPKIGQISEHKIGQISVPREDLIQTEIDLISAPKIGAITERKIDQTSVPREDLITESKIGGLSSQLHQTLGNYPIPNGWVVGHLENGVTCCKLDLKAGLIITSLIVTDDSTRALLKVYGKDVPLDHVIFQELPLIENVSSLIYAMAVIDLYKICYGINSQGLIKYFDETPKTKGFKNKQTNAIHACDCEILVKSTRECRKRETENLCNCCLKYRASLLKSAVRANKRRPLQIANGGSSPSKMGDELSNSSTSKIMDELSNSSTSKIMDELSNSSTTRTELISNSSTSKVGDELCGSSSARIEDCTVRANKRRLRIENGGSSTSKMGDELSNSSTSKIMDELSNSSTSKIMDELSNSSTSKMGDELSNSSTSKIMVELSNSSTSKIMDELSNSSTSKIMDELSISSTARIDETSNSSTTTKMEQCTVRANKRRLQNDVYSNVPYNSSTNKMDELSNNSTTTKMDKLCDFNLLKKRLTCATSFED